MKQNVEQKEKSKKPGAESEKQSESAKAEDRPLTEKEKQQLEHKRQKLRGLQDINQFQLDLYYQKLDMLNKVNVPSIFKEKEASAAQEDAIQTNLNNLVNGAPIFLPSQQVPEQKSRGALGQFRVRKFSQPLHV